jgi:hypothetical protein
MATIKIALDRYAYEDIYPAFKAATGGAAKTARDHVQGRRDGCMAARSPQAFAQASLWLGMNRCAAE